MKIAHIFKFTALTLGCIGLVGCSTHTVTTSKMTGIPTPSISTMNTIADVEVGEPIFGEACSREFLMIFESGDNKFLELYGNGSSGPKDKAKAGAAYKALIAGKGISTDIIVHPIWEITRDKTLFGLVSDEYCAKVAGFRGQIKGFKKAQTMTDPPERRASDGFFGRLFSLNDMSEKH